MNNEIYVIEVYTEDNKWEIADLLWYPSKLSALGQVEAWKSEDATNGGNYDYRVVEFQRVLKLTHDVL